MTIESRITEAIAWAEIILPRLMDGTLALLSALGLLIGGWIAARFADEIIRRVLGRRMHLDATLKPFLASVVRYGILVIVAVAALSQLGIETTSILAVLGAAGLAIGLALQGTLSNIAAGVMLLLLRPLRIGEFIDAEGIAGSVEEIGLFTTIMTTADGLYLSVPNAKLWGSTIKNYSRLPRRRINADVAIAYDADIDKAEAALLAVLTDDPRVLPDPAPEIEVAALGDSAVLLRARFWVRSSDYFPVDDTVLKAMKAALDKAGIAIPFPQRVVRVITGSER